MSIPRSANRSSTLRGDSGYLTYIITTRRMTSGELLKYRNGLVMPQTITPEAAKIRLTKPAEEQPLRRPSQEALLYWGHDKIGATAYAKLDES
jgi:hypothetical protein